VSRADLGRRAICGRCDLEIERHPPIWLDRGNNSHCNLPGQPLHLAAGENVWTLLGPLAKKHCRAIAGQEVTDSTVRGLKKILNADWRRRRGYSTGVTSPNVCKEEVEQLNAAIAHHLPRVVGKLDETGRKLLRSRRYAKRLAPVADIIADLTRFHLIGFDEINSGNHVPIYRAFDSRGRHFTFRNIPWQSVAYSSDSTLESGPVVLAIDKKGLGDEN
jgi:hypothetical protein